MPLTIMIFITVIVYIVVFMPPDMITILIYLVFIFSYIENITPLTD